MRKTYVFFTIILVAASLIAGRDISAQEMKTGTGVSQAYSNLSVDMQYYEIKYDPKSDEYISYYKVIRERIMQKLNSLYRYHYRKGDVYLFFTLNSDGRLDSFDIDRTKSVSDKTLIDIATTSLKRSSPFPKFPAGLSSPKISFNVVISFRDRKGP